MNNLTHLSLSWSVSRGRDTEGYNICRLDDGNTGKRYKCMGGGYDMTGTVFGNWLQDVYQAELQAAGSAVTGLYGARINSEGKVSLDGACGLECMLEIAKAIGLEVEREYIKKGVNRGNTVGWFVQMTSKAV
jgi:hypothetical protein